MQNQGFWTGTYQLQRGSVPRDGDGHRQVARLQVHLRTSTLLPPPATESIVPKPADKYFIFQLQRGSVCVDGDRSGEKVMPVNVSMLQRSSASLTEIILAPPFVTEIAGCTWIIELRIPKLQRSSAKRDEDRSIFAGNKNVAEFDLQRGSAQRDGESHLHAAPSARLHASTWLRLLTEIDRETGVRERLDRVASTRLRPS
jgi:hypothetical protein